MLLVAVLVCPCRNEAQAPCAGDEIFESPSFSYECWVDPCHGDDDTGEIFGSGQSGGGEARSHPFKTIGGALEASSVIGNLGPLRPFIVHLNPGIYTVGPLSLGAAEEGPIQVPEFASILGVNARECVIRGIGTMTNTGDSHPNGVFLPETCDCGTHRSSKVLMSLGTARPTAANDPDTYAEIIQGVTFQGGEIQVLCQSTEDVTARISNCIFDMLDYTNASGLNFRGPDFGILMVHTWGSELSYAEMPIHVLNNTFILGARLRNPTNPETCVKRLARLDAVAICDTNDPVCIAGGGDSDTSLRGVGAPNIQNNLIRGLVSSVCDTGNPVPLDRRAFLGAGQSATQAVLSDSSVINTNYFNTGTDTTSEGGLYCVSFHDSAPQSELDEDPAFVGEMLSRYGLTPAYAQDWRVLPDSVVIDQGVSPTNGTITAANGTTYVEPSWIADDCDITILDLYTFDGEGWGNPRIVGAGVDIGYDEADLVIECGFPNYTLTVTPDPDCAETCVPNCLLGGTVGRGSHLLLFPGLGTYRFHHVTTLATEYNEAYTLFPGMNEGVAAGNGQYWWIPTLPPFPTVPITALVSGYMPYNGTVTHSFAYREIYDTSLTSDDYLVHQGEFNDGVTTRLTNAQPSRD